MQKPRQAAEIREFFADWRFTRDSGANSRHTAKNSLKIRALARKLGCFQGKSDTLTQFEANFVSK